MKNLTFKAYRQPSKEKDQPQPDGGEDAQQSSYLKRREQVRKAQRTHRERKEAYIKSLENEVLQLRTNETKIVQETRNLYSEISRLQRLLSEHGIEASPSKFLGNDLHGLQNPQSSGDDLQSTAATSKFVLSVRRNRKLDQIHVGGGASSLTEGDDFFLSEDSSNVSSNSRWKFGFFGKKNSQGSEGGNSHGHSFNNLSPQSRAEGTPNASTSIIQMDLTSIGMEFVLTLESPCLNHIQGNPKEPHAPTGHALTASAPLLFQSSSASTAQLPSSSWEAPTIGLERLLDLSANLDLGDEMTPVQAWNFVRNHEKFAQTDVRLLRRLVQDLLAEVKCYGFGAVINQAVLENLVFDAFVVGKVF